MTYKPKKCPIKNKPTRWILAGLGLFFLIKGLAWLAILGGFWLTIR